MDHPATSRVRVVLSALILLAGGRPGPRWPWLPRPRPSRVPCHPLPQDGPPCSGTTSTARPDPGHHRPTGSTTSARIRATSEVNSNTNSTSNVYLDGNGHLVIKAINSGGSWTVGQDREHPRRLPGPARRRIGDDRVDSSSRIRRTGSGTGRRSGPSARPRGRAAPWSPPARPT